MALIRDRVCKRFFTKSMITEMRKTPSQFRRLCREYCNRPRLMPEMNTDVLDSIERGECRPKHHAGILKTNNTILPKPLIKNILSAVGDQPIKKLAEDGLKLSRYLHSRHLPVEEEESRRKMEETALLLERTYNKSSTDLTDEERQEFRKKHENKIKTIFYKRIYGWKAVEYSDYQSKVYLIGRSSADYAVVNRIFREMKLRLPDFKPKTLFDFGSGVGTAIWAAKDVWENSVQEYFCVDASRFMNDLALSVITGRPDGQPPKGYFYRQFLPASSTLQYDLVVSAFSLFELPSLKARLEVVLNLWKKTHGYLVIIEHGTNAGFQVINETRDFILDFCNKSQNAAEHAAHVFGPCPHDEPCPRFNEDLTPCNFEVPYTNPFHSTKNVEKEKFSYVILKKGFRPETDPQWPRIVRQVLPRSKHVVCRICTSAGKLQEIVFTASKHGKIVYKCARASNWGDLLPITIKENQENMSTKHEIESVNEKSDV